MAFTTSMRAVRTVLLAYHTTRRHVKRTVDGVADRSIPRGVHRVRDRITGGFVDNAHRIAHAHDKRMNVCPCSFVFFSIFFENNEP